MPLSTPRIGSRRKVGGHIPPFPVIIDRAVDIHKLGEDVRLMLKRCIDPLATDEPFESLPKL
jgi:hypothetical protein